MRIVILAIGTLGDVQPYVALGIGLKKTGYSVCIASHKDFRLFIEGCGLEFAPVGYPQELMSGGDMLKLVDAGSNFISWMRRLLNLVDAIMPDFLNDCWQACWQAEMIIYSPFGWGGYHISQKLSIPSYIASLQPMSRSRYFPAVWSPGWLKLGGCGNRLSHVAVEQVFWQVFRRAANRWRKEVLDLAPIPFGGPFGKPDWQRQSFLYGYSPCVIPKPPDWAQWLHITGYWFLPPDPNWQPPNELVDFLEAGPPPVYAGFGSVPIRNQEKLTETVIEALSSAGKRGILQIGRAEITNLRVSEDIFQAGWIPHDWLFPKMAALIHHGGASTTANGLRAGVPSIIAPFAWDQPFWGRRIAGLGAGPNPIPCKKLTLENLATAIITATTDNKMAENAAAIGKIIKEEDGVARAVEIISKGL
ncbi:glycosyltransferase [Chloroflexota bacterium]